MTTKALKPLPPPTFTVVQPDRRWEQAWADYFDALNQVLMLLNGTGNVALAPVIGPLVNAANDAAAAVAGVPIGGLYRNVNAVQIRLV